MFILAYIIEGFAIVLGLVLTIMYWLILIRALISWVSPAPYNPIVKFLHKATDPVLEPLRHLLMPLTMQIRIDLSPLAAFFIIVFLQRSLVGVLFHIAYMLK
ncbi:MAG: YggT family protein [Candidatus Omnitrophica bacterium]|nr:YggT family protein [Candidatus Omnitrophota bacterium]